MVVSIMEKSAFELEGVHLIEMNVSKPLMTAPTTGRDVETRDAD